MAGYLTASFKLGTTSYPAFVGQSKLDALAIEKYVQTALLNGAGYLDVAAILAKFERAVGLSSVGQITALQKQIYAMTYSETASGTLATVDFRNTFSPYTDTANVTNKKIPAATGCYVTLMGAGGDGGSGGSGAAGFVKGGGGGGGGGGRVARQFIPISQIVAGGATVYTIAGATTTYAQFSTNGGRSITANVGGNGSNGSSGGTGGAGTGGPGGTTSISGFTGISSTFGGDGGNGAGGGVSPQAGGSPSGGGGGGLGPSIAGSNNGAAGTTYGGAGGMGNTSTTGGAGVAGDNANSANQSGGGGGGGGGNGAGVGGQGGNRYVSVEWV